MIITIEDLKKETFCFNTQLNPASIFLSGVEDFSEEILELAEEVKSFSPELAESIAFEAIDFWVLWNDKKTASKWYQEGLQVDTEEWETNRTQRKLAEAISEDDEKSKLLRDALDRFEEKIANVVWGNPPRKRDYRKGVR